MKHYQIVFEKVDKIETHIGSPIVLNIEAQTLTDEEITYLDKAFEIAITEVAKKFNWKKWDY